MKKLFLAVSFLTVAFMNAQEISYGLKAGVNFSNLRYSSDDMSFDEDEKSLTSFHVGCVIEIAFDDKFSLQPELLYTSTGTAAKGTESGISYEGKLKFDYLSLPIMAKYYVAEGFSLEAGPQIGFLMSAKVSADVEDYGSDSEDIKDDTNATDFGVAFGAGYKMENGFFLNARYALGLSNMAKDSDDEWVKNGNIQLSIGYKFN